MPLAETAGRIQRPLATMTDTVVNSAAPMAIPEPGDLWDAWQKGLLSQKRLAEALQYHGIALDKDHLGAMDDRPGSWGRYCYGLWQTVAKLQRPLLTPDQLAVGRLRGVYTDEEYDERLRLLGFDDSRDAATLRTPLFPIPSPGELVLFMVREVFDPQLVKRYGYDQEYPIREEQWFTQQGLTYPLADTGHEAAGLPPLTWARAHWYAHWQLPSPTQGYQMLHRLRPDGGPDGGPRDPSGEVFTLPDLKQLLAVDDYPTFWRGKLAAISYRPIGIQRMRGLWQAGLIDEPEARELFLDQGYVDRDATRLARLLAVETDASALNSTRRKLRDVVVSQYALGLIDATEAAERYYSLSANGAAAVRAAATGQGPPVSQIAASDPGTQSALTLAGTRQALGRAKALVASVRRAYLRAGIDRQQAADLLRSAGVTEEARANYLAQWDVERLTPTVRQTPQRLLHWLSQGWLTPEQVTPQLLAAGWSLRDAGIAVQSAQLQAVNLRVRALAATSRGVSRGIEEQEAAARAAQRALSQAQAVLRRSSSPAALTRFVVRGLLPLDELCPRLAALGVTQEDCQLYLADARRALEARVARDRARTAVASTRPEPGGRVPSAQTVAKWYWRGLIGGADAVRRLTYSGYSFGDAVTLIAGSEPNKGGSPRDSLPSAEPGPGSYSGSV